MAPMNYFVNENMFTLNSGTEFSAIKRLRLFRKNKIPAKILTRNYNSQLAGDMERVGLSHHDVLNMYDYFQEIVTVPERKLDVRYTSSIDKKIYHIEGEDANQSLIKHVGKTIAKVLIAPGTIGLVGSIEYYNDMNEVVAKDFYDRRGFKSSTQYFHADNAIGTQIFFDFFGHPKIELTHMNIKGKLYPTMYKLLDYKGRAYRFNTEEELFTFFLNEIVKEEKIVLINDRPSLIPSVASVKGAFGKWQFLHNAHSLNNQTKEASHQLVPYLIPLFTTYKDAFDGIMVPTKEQRDEIANYFNIKNVVSLPDTFADEFALNTQKRPHKMIYLGRMAAEKNPIDVLEILKRARLTCPDLTLDIYGYASPAMIQEEMTKKVKEWSLQEGVTFKGYQPSQIIEKALDEAAVLLSTSENEAFGMQVLEGLSHGVPAVVYHVQYGLSELIEDGKSGKLVSYGSLDEAAQAIVDVLSGEMIQAAYDRARQFSAQTAWSRWIREKQTQKNLFVGSED